MFCRFHRQVNSGNADGVQKGQVPLDADNHRRRRESEKPTVASSDVDKVDGIRRLLTVYVSR